MINILLAPPPWGRACPDLSGGWGEVKKQKCSELMSTQKFLLKKTAAMIAAVKPFREF
jgi:hypothetical protein